ncbi:unnamed protein product, partial [Candidula unifasciata]
NCFPIELPPNDPSFPGVCLHFIRSLAAEDLNGNQLKPRQQTTTVTSFIDCSQVYGSTPEVNSQIRAPSTWSFLLRTKNNNFLPESLTAGCNKRPGTDDYCFESGDARVNQNPFIAAMHTVWLREHNRIARKLKRLKPGSSNEEIFQLARKIFSSAAFRFGHSTISSFVPTRNGSHLLRNHFNRYCLTIISFIIRPNVSFFRFFFPNYLRVVDKLVEYFFSLPFSVEDVSKFLFLNQATGRGLDLATINIHRGRDHGVQPYVKW